MSKETEQETLLVNEISLLLSEKRTYLSILRTGVAIFGLSVTVLSVLVAITEYREFFTGGAFVGIIVVLGAIALIGLGLTVQAERKVRRIDHMVKRIEKESKRVAEIVV